mmetsp:Transcript_41248/g.108949  ORF Transcript_41248/g.108949 Transcript_41248/m.108949 type:complete len:263 (+) Transcript_41248:668-1456(+)
MRSTSSGDRRSEFAIVILAALPDVASSADTDRMPLASTSNVTSICASPRGIGGNPESSNVPRRRLSLESERSPSKTLLVTATWLSSDVVYRFVLDVGTTVFRGMIGPMTPPVVSMPSVRGVTSRSKRSWILRSFSPESTPAWTAAPYATASSGLIDAFGSLPLKKRLSSALTFGMRVEPPTSTTSDTSDFSIAASSRTFSTGTSVWRKRAAQSSSNLARVTVSDRSTPGRSASISTRTSACDERARFARSASRRSFCTAEAT